MMRKIQGESMDFWGEPLTEEIGGQEEFITQDVPLDIIGQHNAKTELKWSLDVEARKWGIKSIYITVPPQVLSYVAEEDDEEGNATEVSKVLEITGDVKIELEAPEDLKGSVSISPKLIEVYKGKVTVKFGL